MIHKLKTSTSIPGRGLESLKSESVRISQISIKYMGWTRFFGIDQQFRDTAGLLKYQKEDLEGIVFGMRITYENAKLIYETVKKNYLDEGIVVNFYEAIEVQRQYEVKIEQIKIFRVLKNWSTF